MVCLQCKTLAFFLTISVRRSNPLRRGVRHQRGDEERHSRVVREGGDQGQGGEQPGGYVGGDSNDGGDDDRPMLKRFFQLKG